MKSVSIKDGWVLERGDGYVEMHIPDEMATMLAKVFKERAMSLSLMCRPDLFGDTITKLREVAYAIDDVLKGK